MIGALQWICVALGLGVIVVRRRSVAIALVSGQALLLAVIALGEHVSAGEQALVAIAVALRGAGLGIALILVVRRTREARPVPSGAAPFLRAGLGVSLALLLAALAPRLGLDSRDAERAALALLAFGLVTAVTRRATLLQVAGLVMVENGVALAALAVPGGASVVVELGAALDLLLIGLVAVAFHERIVLQFGSGDSSRLRSLRD